MKNSKKFQTQPLNTQHSTLSTPHLSAFTLIEMLIAILLTALVFTYLYATLDTVRGDRGRYERSVGRTLHAQRIYDLLTMDLTRMRSPVTGSTRLSTAVGTTIFPPLLKTL